MIKVKVTNFFKKWDMARQTPGRSSCWGDYQFFFNTTVEECDFWIVHEKLWQADQTVCPPDHVFFISHEPPSLRSYNADFLRQFNLVVAQHSDLDHPNVRNSQPSVPWFLGQQFKFGQVLEAGHDYDELKANPFPPKEALFSTITSHYNVYPSHKKRFEFVERLKAELGDELAFFGRGTNHLPDKWDGIAPYKYHLAIENSRHPNYWTEKLADPFLAGAHPIYCGCPNITDYFPAGALTLIDIDNFEEALTIIRDTIHSDRFEQSLADRQRAKELVLDTYNFFPAVARLCDEAGPSFKAKELITVKPEEDFQTLDERKTALKSELANPRRNVRTTGEILKQDDYIDKLVETALRSEEYAKSLEKEVEKQRAAYYVLEEAYRESLGQREKAERAYTETYAKLKELEKELATRPATQPENSKTRPQTSSAPLPDPSNPPNPSGSGSSDPFVSPGSSDLPVTGRLRDKLKKIGFKR